MIPLREATIREGSTLKCQPAARPDSARGVTAVKLYWRSSAHGASGASSYDDDSEACANAAKAVAGALASRASTLNTRRYTRTLSANTARVSVASATEAAVHVDAQKFNEQDPAADDNDFDPGSHPVLRALLERKRSGSRPGARSDGMRIGLAVEGGGMRGVISAGGTGEILRLGFFDCFDAVYGSSAGVMNLTYYLAKQPEGVAAYHEDMVGGRFLDLARLTAGPTSAPVMDVSYLVDGVMDGVTNRALRWDLVMNSPVHLKVVATSLDCLTPVLLEGPFADVDDLKWCLKASAAVPVFAGGEPVVHRGQTLTDAAVLEPVPVNAAAADGCTHILVLCTRSLPPPGVNVAGSRSKSASAKYVGDGLTTRSEEELEERRQVLVAAEGAESEAAAGGAYASAGSASAIAVAAAATAAGRGPATDERSRRMFFSRVGGFIARRRASRRDNAVIGARAGLSLTDDIPVSTAQSIIGGGGEGDSAVAVARDVVIARARPAATSTRRDRPRTKTRKRDRISKAFNGLLYKTIRGALLNPLYMKDAWAIADAAARLVDDEFATDLDAALVLARDDPAAAAAGAVFPGGAHVFSISPVAATMPRGVNSLCTDAAALAAGSRAGGEATRQVLALVLAGVEEEDEVAYYIDTMCERTFL